MNKQLHARKRRQFKSLSKQLNRLLQGEHTRASKQKMEAIMLKIKHLIRELSGIIARWEMKKTLGVAAVMFGLATSSVQGQSFAGPVANPLGLSSSDAVLIAPVLVDLDADGDLDLLAGELIADYATVTRNFVYYENVGTASEPSFDTGQESPFDLDIPGNRLILPAVVDMDSDGDIDMFIATYSYNGYGSDLDFFITYYENTGTASAPDFGAGQDFPFGTAALSDKNYAVLTFSDLDGDGDFDLIVGSSSYDYTEPFNYLENIGTSTAPEFAAPQANPPGLSFSSDTEVYLALHSIADLDLDGDLDILCGISGYSYANGVEYQGGMFYFENTGTTTNPQFEVSERNPLGITIPTAVVYGLMIPALGDLDNDGDIDMLSASLGGGFFYYENTLDPVSTTAPQADFPVNISPNPTNNYFNINTDEPLSQIGIYDLFGRQLATYDGQQTRISIQDLSKGTYVIRLVNQEGEYLSKRIEKL